MQLQIAADHIIEHLLLEPPLKMQQDSKFHACSASALAHCSDCVLTVCCLVVLCTCQQSLQAVSFSLAIQGIDLYGVIVKQNRSCSGQIVKVTLTVSPLLYRYGLVDCKSI